MSDFLEVKARRVEIASGWGLDGSRLTLVDVPPKEMDTEEDAEKLAEWLWSTVPMKTLDLAIEKLARRDEVAKEELGLYLQGD